MHSGSNVRARLAGETKAQKMCEKREEKRWEIRPCAEQPERSSIETTNEGPVPLPFAIELDTGCSEVMCCRYIGHGASKVTFILQHRAEVLKVSKVADTEPQVCNALRLRSEGEALCPAVLQSSRCVEFDALGMEKREWLAWITEYTPALNQVLQLPEIDRRACMMSALYVQVRAAQLGLLLSDNNLFNFGVALDFGGVAKPTGSFTLVTDKRVWREKLAQQRCCVVILDTGSRTLEEPGAIDWHEQNKRCMTGWWYNLKWQAVDPSDYEEVKRVWHATKSIKGLVDCLRGKHYCQVAEPDLVEEQEIEESSFTNAPLSGQAARSVAPWRSA